MDGVKGGHDGIGSSMSAVKKRPTVKRRKKMLTIEDYYEGVVNNNRPVMARAITLIESNAKKTL